MKKFHRPLILLGGIAASAALAGGTMFALGGFTATVTNSGAGFASGTIVLSEGQGATTCLSTSTDVITSNSTPCTTINLFGTGNAVPGTSNATALAFKNLGSVNASTFTLTPTACTAAANTATSPYSGSDTTGFCGKVDVTIENTTNAAAPVCVYPVETGACPAPSSSDTLASLGSGSPVSLGALAASGTDNFTITTELDNSATNADQGLAATESVTWELSQ